MRRNAYFRVRIPMRLHPSHRPHPLIARPGEECSLPPEACTTMSDCVAIVLLASLARAAPWYPGPSSTVGRTQR